MDIEGAEYEVTLKKKDENRNPYKVHIDKVCLEINKDEDCWEVNNDVNV